MLKLRSHGSLRGDNQSHGISNSPEAAIRSDMLEKGKERHANKTCGGCI